MTPSMRVSAMLREWRANGARFDELETAITVAMAEAVDAEVEACACVAEELGRDCSAPFAGSRIRKERGHK